MGVWLAETPQEQAWQGSWTIFYWGWWISWAPFVGLFIARISRGRTIREFILGVLLVPVTFVFFWLCMFGGNAIWQEIHAVGGPAANGGAELINAVRNWDLPSILYATIANLGHMSWLGNLNWLIWPLSALATFLLISWFVTSADSGTLVITTMLSMGSNNPPILFRVFWGMGIGLVAEVLLTVGGLAALQTMSISAALPISIGIVIMSCGLLHSLHAEFDSLT